MHSETLTRILESGDPVVGLTELRDELLKQEQKQEAIDQNAIRQFEGASKLGAIWEALRDEQEGANILDALCMLDDGGYGCDAKEAKIAQAYKLLVGLVHTGATDQHAPLVRPPLLELWVWKHADEDEQPEIPDDLDLDDFLYDIECRAESEIDADDVLESLETAIREDPLACDRNGDKVDITLCCGGPGAGFIVEVEDDGEPHRVVETYYAWWGDNSYNTSGIDRDGLLAYAQCLGPFYEEE